MPTNSSAHTSELTERDDTRISFASRLSGVERTRLCAARMPTGSAMTSASSVPSDAMWIVSISALCTSTGYAAQSTGHIRVKQVADLLRRVGEELRDDLDRLHGGDDGRDDDEVDEKARQPLARREAAPDALVRRQHRDAGHRRTLTPAALISRPRRDDRAGSRRRRAKRSASVAPPMKILRTAVANNSPTMMSEMIAIRIAQTKS